VDIKPEDILRFLSPLHSIQVFLIVDELTKLAKSYRGRASDPWRTKAVEALFYPWLLGLTATPMESGLIDIKNEAALGGHVGFVSCPNFWKPDTELTEKQRKLKHFMIHEFVINHIHRKTQVSPQLYPDPKAKRSYRVFYNASQAYVEKLLLSCMDFFKTLTRSKDHEENDSEKLSSERGIWIQICDMAIQEHVNIRKMHETILKEKMEREAKTSNPNNEPSSEAKSKSQVEACDVESIPAPDLRTVFQSERKCESAKDPQNEQEETKVSKEDSKASLSGKLQFQNFIEKIQRQNEKKIKKTNNPFLYEIPAPEEPDAELQKLLSPICTPLRSGPLLRCVPFLKKFFEWLCTLPNGTLLRLRAAISQGFDKQVLSRELYPYRSLQCFNCSAPQEALRSFNRRLSNKIDNPNSRFDRLLLLPSVGSQTSISTTSSGTSQTIGGGKLTAQQIEREKAQKVDLSPIWEFFQRLIRGIEIQLQHIIEVERHYYIERIAVEPAHKSVYNDVVQMLDESQRPQTLARNRKGEILWNLLCRCQIGEKIVVFDKYLKVLRVFQKYLIQRDREETCKAICYFLRCGSAPPLKWLRKNCGYWTAPIFSSSFKYGSFLHYQGGPASVQNINLLRFNAPEEAWRLSILFEWRCEYFYKAIYKIHDPPYRYEYIRWRNSKSEPKCVLDEQTWSCVKDVIHEDKQAQASNMTLAPLFVDSDEDSGYLAEMPSICFVQTPIVIMKKDQVANNINSAIVHSQEGVGFEVSRKALSHLKLFHTVAMDRKYGFYVIPSVSSVCTRIILQYVEHLAAVPEFESQILMDLNYPIDPDVITRECDEEKKPFGLFPISIPEELEDEQNGVSYFEQILGANRCPKAELEWNLGFFRNLFASDEKKIRIDLKERILDDLQKRKGKGSGACLSLQRDWTKIEAVWSTNLLYDLILACNFLGSFHFLQMLCLYLATKFIKGKELNTFCANLSAPRTDSPLLVYKFWSRDENEKAMKGNYGWRGDWTKGQREARRDKYLYFPLKNYINYDPYLPLYLIERFCEKPASIDYGNIVVHRSVQPASREYDLFAKNHLKPCILGAGNLLFVTTGAGSAVIPLQTAQHAVYLSPLSMPSVMIQAGGRLERIGQKCAVESHHFHAVFVSSGKSEDLRQGRTEGLTYDLAIMRSLTAPRLAMTRAHLGEKGDTLVHDVLKRENVSDSELEKYKHQIRTASISQSTNPEVKKPHKVTSKPNPKSETKVNNKTDSNSKETSTLPKRGTKHRNIEDFFCRIVKKEKDMDTKVTDKIKISPNLIPEDEPKRKIIYRKRKKIAKKESERKEKRTKASEKLKSKESGKKRKRTKDNK
jgi:hypothetical protein